MDQLEVEVHQEQTTHYGRQFEVGLMKESYCLKDPRRLVLVVPVQIYPMKQVCFLSVA